jgi:methionyl-tRNA synthetase
MSDKPAVVAFEDFAKLDLRVATVISAEPHPNADKLVVLRLDVAGQPRTIVAGIRGHYEPAPLAGTQIVIVANLAPRVMRGIESQGMLLAAVSADHSAVVLVRPDKPIASGSAVS